MYMQAWQFWAVLSAVFAALTALFAKIGVQDINSNLATFIRTMVILGVIFCIVTFSRQWVALNKIPSRTLVFLVLSGCATGASWLCYFRALQLGEAARVAPIDKLSVVMVAIFATLFLGERLSAVNWGGVVLIAVGALLVALK